MRNFEFLKIYNSPFKLPRLKFYIGKVAIGTPYFLPRKWVKATPEIAMEAAINEIAERKKWNKQNVNSDFKHTIPSLDESYEQKLRYQFPVPKKIGFDFVGLGYKTKWSDTDYRHEWNPIWSFVFFKWQIALIFNGPDSMSTSHYWEAWLYYRDHIDKNLLSMEARVEVLKKEFPQTYTIYKNNGSEEKINYYDAILKKKYNG
jgi:hypothetical protein